jgi:hypothetical protein
MTYHRLVTSALLLPGLALAGCVGQADVEVEQDTASAIGEASADLAPDLWLWRSSSGSGKCIGTANSGSMINGTRLVVWDCHGHMDQRWVITQTGLLRNIDSGKCIGTENSGSMANGTRLVVWDCHGHPDQRWQLTATSLLMNPSGGKCVGTANGGSMSNGTELVVWDCHGHPDQLWSLFN